MNDAFRGDAVGGVGADEAFALMERGVFMSARGYTWRNHPNGYGEYWAWGEYPACVRTCEPFTVESVRRTADRWTVAPLTRKASVEAGRATPTQEKAHG